MMTMTYEAKPERGYWTTPLENCDVENKEALRLYRRKRAEWLDWLHGDDDHAIGHQIRLMSWSYVVFRMINESRALARASGQPSAALNGTLAEFNDSGFVLIQALAIRRLMEPEAKHEAKQVISLRRLVDDLERHQKLFTREIFVGFDGAPFDPEPGRAQWWDETEKRLANSSGPEFWGEAYLTAGPDAWRHAYQLHRTFDRLSATYETSRSRHEKIFPEIFKNLKEYFNNPAIHRTYELCNKRIAHAADAISRSYVKQSAKGISFNDIDAAHRAIITVAEFVSGCLLSHMSLGAMPIPQFNQFEHLDADWLDKAGVERLSQFWKDLTEERNRWICEATELILGPNL